MSQFKKNGTMELETSIGYSFSLIKTEYKQNKIYQNKKKTKRTVNLSFQSALCQQSETGYACFFMLKMKVFFPNIVSNMKNKGFLDPLSSKRQFFALTSLYPYISIVLSFLDRG